MQKPIKIVSKEQLKPGVIVGDRSKNNIIWYIIKEIKQGNFDIVVYEIEVGRNEIFKSLSVSNLFIGDYLIGQFPIENFDLLDELGCIDLT
jgi:hypothetical protein